MNLKKILRKMLHVYYFEQSDIFYVNPHSKVEVINLMINDIEKHDSFVISSVTGDYELSLQIKS